MKPPSRASSGGSATSARPAGRAGRRARSGRRAASRQHRRSRRRGRHRGDLPGLRQPVADRGQVARPAAVQRQPRQGAVDVGHAAQRLAQVGAQAAASSTSAATASCRAWITSRSRDGRAERRSSSRAPAAVTVRSMAASSEPVAPARQRVGQFQVAPRGRVDLHRRRRRLRARGGRRQRQLALLRDAPDSRRCAPIADISARLKLPKASSEPTPKSRTAAVSPPATVEAAPRGRAVSAAPASAAMSARSASRLGDQHFARGQPGQFRAKPRRGQGITCNSPVEMSTQASAPRRAPRQRRRGSCGAAPPAAIPRSGCRG